MPFLSEPVCAPRMSLVSVRFLYWPRGWVRGEYQVLHVGVSDGAGLGALDVLVEQRPGVVGHAVRQGRV